MGEGKGKGEGWGVRQRGSGGVGAWECFGGRSSLPKQGFKPAASRFSASDLNHTTSLLRCDFEQLTEAQVPTLCSSELPECDAAPETAPSFPETG